jgi:hypothetical protein
MEPVTTGQIYWGAVPFVGIQIIMVALVILFPGMVMHYKDVGSGVDPATIEELDIPEFDLGPPIDFGAPGGELAPPADLLPPAELRPPGQP